MNLWEMCLGIFYPQTCCFCGKVSTKMMCDSCAGKIQYLSEPICKRCGKPIQKEEQEYCKDCTDNQFEYEQGRSLWIHQGLVKKSIYHFKYHNRRIYGRWYAQELFRLYGHKLKEWEIDLIIPVPLHKRKKRRRGYNQAEIIAKYLGNLTNIPVDTKTVVRIRNTKAQKHLDNQERKRNLKSAFRVKETWKGAQNVLLIDDIYTTGATINGVATVLKEKGVQKVWFLTISIGQGF